MGLRKSCFVSLRVGVSAIAISFLAACGTNTTNAPTATPARELSAPTLAASPTVHIQPSGDIYGESDVNPGQLDPTAASLPSGSSLPPLVVGTPNAGGHHSVQILLEDGTQVSGDLYQRGISRVPGVLLLATDKEAWGFLPVRLYSAGMTVLVVETRENPLPTDMDNLLVSLSEIGTVDPAQIAVVGAAQDADFALTGCAASGICDAVVLLSPLDRNALLQAMQTYTPRPVLVIAAEDDTASYSASVAVASAATSTSQLLSYPTGKGTALLELQPELIDLIVTWLVEQFPLMLAQPENTQP